MTNLERLMQYAGAILLSTAVPEEKRLLAVCLAQVIEGNLLVSWDENANEPRFSLPVEVDCGPNSLLQ